MAPRHCLLIVDDEIEVVQSLQDLLRFDYRVLGATRATEGLQLIEKEEVHIVMSDQRMPEMSGVEFLQKLRQSHPDIVPSPFYRFMPIFMPSSKQSTPGNVFRYISKPWDVDELQVTLKQAAERL
ncbi:MAG: hypothetical protein KatS3mg105_0715 [Gemmatales bacterium]|nr:MAG: hypothetical protein KatS3mg105_0715 [Gemmatales bacterium]